MLDLEKFKLQKLPSFKVTYVTATSTLLRNCWGTAQLFIYHI